jgi:hypothetical protein
MEAIEVNNTGPVVRALWTLGLAAVFAGGLTAAAVATEPAHEGAAAEKEGHVCPHAKAAAEANGTAAAPCDHAKEGGCASCDDAKDCPHAKGEACSDCADKAPSH